MTTRHKYSPYGYKRTGTSWSPLAGNIPVAISRETPGFAPVISDVKDECEGCRMASHGFMCNFSNGTCLKTIFERRTANALGDPTATAGCETG